MFQLFFPQYTESQWCPKQNIFNICVLQKKRFMQVCNMQVVEYMIADIFDDSWYFYDMNIFGELSL